MHDPNDERNATQRCLTTAMQPVSKK